MKTAQELYDFCKETEYGQGVQSGKLLKVLAIIEDALAQDEDVLLCFAGLHNHRGLGKHEGDYVYAVSEKRIIYTSAAPNDTVVQTIPLNEIVDVTCEPRALKTTGINTIKTAKQTLPFCTSFPLYSKIHSDLKNILGL